MKYSAPIFALSWMLIAHAWADVRPNLLLFLADDMTYTDLGCYGNSDVRTPHLDALANEGCRFTRFYNSAPTCSPLRQSLYTGLYPVRNGAHPNHSRVHPWVRSLPNYLSDLGYETAIVGKRHEAPASSFPFRMLGGRHHDGGKSPDGTDLPLEPARKFIEQQRDEPWCLVVASNQPHAPWNRGDSSVYLPESLTVPPYLVDTPELRSALSNYYAEVTYMDRQVGKMMKHLRELDQVDRTLVLWLSEQGSQMPFGKWTCYEMGIHAAAIARWPAQIQAGRVSDALISYVDVVPTFDQLAGGDPEAMDFDGESFSDVLSGETSNHHEFVFSVNTTRGIYDGSEAYGIRSVTDGEWLLIRNLHPNNRFQNMVTERSTLFRSWKDVDSSFARERVAAYQQRPAVELFHLQTDPWCMNNIAGADQADQVLNRLSARLDDWMRQQGDAGDATEMDAKNRQPKRRPWALKTGYQRRD